MQYLTRNESRTAKVHLTLCMKISRSMARSKYNKIEGFIPSILETSRCQSTDIIIQDDRPSVFIQIQRGKCNTYHDGDITSVLDPW